MDYSFSELTALTNKIIKKAVKNKKLSSCCINDDNLHSSVFENIVKAYYKYNPEKFDCVEKYMYLNGTYAILDYIKQLQKAKSTANVSVEASYIHENPDYDDDIYIDNICKQANLTNAETFIKDSIMKGHSFTEIAEAKNVTESFVKFLYRSIIRKLYGVHKKSQRG